MRSTPDYAGRVSVVVPVRNEADNVIPLIAEIHLALDGRAEFEIVYVDDGSTDATPERLAEAQQRFPRLRVIRLRESCGQSTALATAVHAARHPWIATLDGDCENDPDDIPRLLDVVSPGRRGPGLEMVAGWRAERLDGWLPRLGSRLAKGVRAALLGDATPDARCGLKVFSRRLFLNLPFFDNQHRFLPALFLREGAQVVSVPVRHRPRVRGESKYGVLDRVRVGTVDFFGVLWLMRRMKHPAIDT